MQSIAPEVNTTMFLQTAGLVCQRQLSNKWLNPKQSSGCETVLKNEHKVSLILKLTCLLKVVSMSNIQ